MVLDVHQAGLGKMLAERGMYATVLSKGQSLLNQQRLRYIKHGVVSPGDGKLGIPVGCQPLRRVDRQPGFLHQLSGLVLHIAKASARTLLTKALSPARHSSSEMKTRLMVSP